MNRASEVSMAPLRRRRGLDRPVFVIGAPRSGKTAVACVVRSSTEFLHFHEPLLIWNTGMAGRADDVRRADDATPDVRERILTVCRRRLSGEGRRRYVDDLGHHVLRIPFLLRVAPDARIIHLVRDPRRVIPEMLFGWTHTEPVRRLVHRHRRVLAWRTLPRAIVRFARNYARVRMRGERACWGPRVPGLVRFAADHSAAEVAAFQWRSLVELARTELRRVPEACRLEVRFEDLLERPGATAARISEFTQADDPAASIAFAERHADPSFVNPNRVEPTAEQWRRIDRMIGPICAALGYRDRHTGGH